MKNAEVQYCYKHKSPNCKPKQGTFLVWVILVMFEE